MTLQDASNSADEDETKQTHQSSLEDSISSLSFIMQTATRGSHAGRAGKRGAGLSH